MGWLRDSSHRGQGHQAWTAVGLPTRYPLTVPDINNHSSFSRYLYETDTLRRKPDIYSKPDMIIHVKQVHGVLNASPYFTSAITPLTLDNIYQKYTLDSW